jgi:phosphatidylserine decarboxylase
MTFHKEGYPTLLITLLFSAIIIGASVYFTSPDSWLSVLAYAASGFLLVTVLQFFRNPSRSFVNDEKTIISPADGKVVVIEKVFEPEFLKTECMQISVFMSPINVHINRFPVSGTVAYAKYHPGLYLVAWHPKSSTENERTSIAVSTPQGKTILFRQIAGALARRIVYYCKEGDKAQQCGEMGFIKFGSRVDVFVPLDAKIKVQLNEVVTGGISHLAEF